MGQLFILKKGYGCNFYFFINFFFAPQKHHFFLLKLRAAYKPRLYLCTVLIKNPNFLVLDEPTNDLDIVTLNILEEYLVNFKGCVIVISHDRYFMDKVVDHLLVFEGDAAIRNFPGNYSHYREWRQEEDKKISEETKAAAAAKTEPETKTQTSKPEVKTKLTFKEKIEFEGLEQKIADLEQEKEELTNKLSSGELPPDELVEVSNKITGLIALIDEKTMRWLELSEFES